MASRTLDLPRPVGPTTPVTPRSNVNSVRLAKDLKPHISSFLSCIFPSLYPGPERREGCTRRCESPSLFVLRILYRGKKANSEGNVRSPNEQNHELRITNHGTDGDDPRASTWSI